MIWKPVDIVVLVLAATVAACVVTAGVHMIFFDATASDIDSLVSVLTAMLGIVSVYIGHAMRKETKVED